MDDITKPRFCPHCGATSKEAARQDNWRLVFIGFTAALIMVGMAYTCVVFRHYFG